VRGLANLKLGKGAEAAIEFQKILDHCGRPPLSVLYPLAHLGLARAAALQAMLQKRTRPIRTSSHVGKMRTLIFQF
jgi:hypothetical protein